MQLKSIFRGLVLAEWVIPFLSIPAIYTRFFSAEALHEATTPHPGMWFIVPFSTAASIAAVAASIGLWRFRRWGRTLFVAVQLVTWTFGLLTPLLHWSATKSTAPFPTTPLDSFVGPITGAIIALAYASPVATEFGRAQDAHGMVDSPVAEATSG